MLLKSNYYVENLEIPESGPELPPLALLTQSLKSQTYRAGIVSLRGLFVF